MDGDCFLMICPYCGVVLECPPLYCPHCDIDLDEKEVIDYFAATAEDMEIEAALEIAHGI